MSDTKAVSFAVQLAGHLCQWALHLWISPTPERKHFFFKCLILVAWTMSLGQH